MPANTNYVPAAARPPRARAPAPGTGRIRINDRTIEEFFGPRDRAHDRAPALEAVQMTDRSTST